MKYPRCGSDLDGAKYGEGAATTNSLQSPPCSWRTWLGAILVCHAASLSALALDSLVVPNGLETKDGDLSDNFVPFNLGSPVRYQQDYGASQFTATGGPMLIKEIRFRNDADLGRPFDVILPDVQISLSTTRVAPSALSVFFARNIGPNETEVFPRGPLHLRSQSLGFDIVIGLADPFLYNPSEGNLLMDIKYYGSVATISRMDAQGANSSKGTTSGVFSGSTQSTFGELTGTGLVTQFIYDPVPEPSLTCLFLAISFALAIRKTICTR